MSILVPFISLIKNKIKVVFFIVALIEHYCRQVPVALHCARDGFLAIVNSQQITRVSFSMNLAKG
jgi:hypothetical protein